MENTSKVLVQVDVRVLQQINPELVEQIEVRNNDTGEISTEYWVLNPVSLGVDLATGVVTAFHAA